MTRWSRLAIVPLLLAAAALAACSGDGGAEEAHATPARTASTETVPIRSPTPAFPRPRPSPAPAGAVELIVVSDGSTDSLFLEWSGGPANVSEWQYRRTTWRQNQQDPWGAWEDIPGSGPSTRSYRLTGLSHSTGHRFEVRAVVGMSAGPASNRAQAITRTPGDYPLLWPETIGEGDGRTEWGVHTPWFVITIPAGVRLESSYTRYSPEDDVSSIAVWIVEPYGAGGLLFSTEGEVLIRYVPPPEDASDGNAQQQATAVRDIGALLDRIISSLRHPD